MQSYVRLDDARAYASQIKGLKEVNNQCFAYAADAPCKEREINMLVSDLQARTEGLQKNISLVRDRLVSVLRDELRPQEPCNQTGPPAPSTPLGRRLQDIQQSVDWANAQLSEILSLLEV